MHFRVLGALTIGSLAGAVLPRLDVVSRWNWQDLPATLVGGVTTVGAAAAVSFVLAPAVARRSAVAEWQARQTFEATAKFDLQNLGEELQVSVLHLVHHDDPNVLAAATNIANLADVGSRSGEYLITTAAAELSSILATAASLQREDPAGERALEGARHLAQALYTAVDAVRDRGALNEFEREALNVAYKWARKLADTGPIC
jgi:hypothetical protein